MRSPQDEEPARPPEEPGPGSIDAREAVDAGSYDELLRLAEHYLRSDLRGSLTPSVLVHEAWVKLGRHGRGFRELEHFKATAARAMRQILVDRARAARAQHGRVTVSSSMFEVEETAIDLERLDLALQRLEQEHPRCARVVELRFFGGLTYEEIAGMIGFSERAAQGDWAFARSWLLREMER
jgi:RNA polymerase sigma factor (TIGR02999 family)